MASCTVCGSDMGAPIYSSGRPRSLTTMNTLIEGESHVYFCDTCGHAQTTALPDLERFYAQDYDINIFGGDDDQLYDVVDGKEVYRSEHQATVLARKIDLSQYRKVLDYGCAKATTLRQVRDSAPDTEAFLFDVTDRYLDTWEAFPGPRQYAAHTPDPAWKGQMDVVLSFYALEHIEDLASILGNIKALLRDGGYFYFLVPNMYANAADFVVADHVNHFSEASLTYLLQGNGFTDIDIDTEAHHAAFVVMARLDASGQAARQPLPDFAAARAQAVDLAAFWGGMDARIAAHEATLGPDRPRAIYGAGIYGNYIYSCLTQPDRVTHFIDQNKYLAGKHVQGKPVVAPAEYPGRDAGVFVGLNPRIARAAIGSVDAFAGKGLDFFFLD